MMYSTILLASMTLAADVPVQGKPDPVIRWNEVTLQLIRAEKTPPPMAARNLAMVHIAMYDAVQSVRRTHQTFLIDSGPWEEASTEAAATVAAHRVLVKIYPARKEWLDEVLQLSKLNDQDGISDGRELGECVARKLFAARQDDGIERRTSYKPRLDPGFWQPTEPGFKPALLPNWPNLRPFALKTPDQFRPDPPPSLNSVEYRVAYREVKALGGIDSKIRTDDQTVIAKFWACGEGTSTPPGHWNRIAQTVSKDRGISFEENARLFALLNVALADAGISCWDCKFRYDFWRPIQAIREVEPTWTPLLPTPPFPAFSSGHSTFSGAGAYALAHFFGSDDITFVSMSEGLPDVKRTYTSFSQAADEAGMSRIYGGIHWQFDNNEGLHCGREIGEYICKRFMLKK